MGPIYSRYAEGQTSRARKEPFEGIFRNVAPIPLQILFISLLETTKQRVGDNCDSLKKFFSERHFGSVLQKDPFEEAFGKHDLNPDNAFTRVFQKTLFCNFGSVLQKTFSEKTLVTPAQQHVSHYPRNSNPIKTQLQFAVGVQTLVFTLFLSFRNTAYFSFRNNIFFPLLI